MQRLQLIHSITTTHTHEYTDVHMIRHNQIMHTHVHMKEVINFTVQNLTFSNLKLLETGPLRFNNDDVKVLSSYFTRSHCLCTILNS